MWEQIGCHLLPVSAAVQYEVVAPVRARLDKSYSFQLSLRIAPLSIRIGVLG
jgi:hypothetical protein